MVQTTEFSCLTSPFAPSCCSQGLTIISRHQQPHHTLSFLACLHEICRGAATEAAATSEEAAAIAKQLTAQQTHRVQKRRALKLALHAAAKLQRNATACARQEQQTRSGIATTLSPSNQESHMFQGRSSDPNAVAAQHSAALNYFTERAARKKQRRDAVTAAAAASIPGTQPADNGLDSSESELDSDSEPEEGSDLPTSAPVPTFPHSGSSASQPGSTAALQPGLTAATDTTTTHGTATPVEDLFTIPPQVIVSVEQKAVMDQRFRRLHGAAVVASSVAEASSPLIMAPVLQVGTAIQCSRAFYVLRDEWW